MDLNTILAQYLASTYASVDMIRERFAQNTVDGTFYSVHKTMSGLIKVVKSKNAKYVHSAYWIDGKFVPRKQFDPQDYD
jgi:hypothetical protein